MSHPLTDVVHRHRHRVPIGIRSVCSAHPLVLKAAVRQALADDIVVLIEATSNPVHQVGGHTGMRPARSRDLVPATASRCGLPVERVVLGDDHLGPNTWRGPAVQQAQTRLLADLAAREVPPPLLSQHLPEQYTRVRRYELGADPSALAVDRVRDVLRDYAGATIPASPQELR